MGLSIYNIKKWTKMFLGKSVLHVKQDLGQKFSPGELNGYFNNLTEKVKKDPIFIPIIAKISIPFNLEENESTKKLEEKEIKAKEHLEEMFEITRHLSYNDIELLNYNKNKEKEELKEQDKNINEGRQLE